MQAGIEITKGLNGLIEIFCSNSELKRKVNKEGAYSEFDSSIVAGVKNSTKHKKKISKKYFLLIDEIIKQNKNVHKIYIDQYI